jgi:hypothetical protein
LRINPRCWLLENGKIMRGKIKEGEEGDDSFFWDRTAPMLSPSAQALTGCSTPQGVPYGSGGAVGQVRDAFAEEPA